MPACWGLAPDKAGECCWPPLPVGPLSLFALGRVELAPEGPLASVPCGVSGVLLSQVLPCPSNDSTWTPVPFLAYCLAFFGPLRTRQSVLPWGTALLRPLLCGTPRATTGALARAGILRFTPARGHCHSAAPPGLFDSRRVVAFSETLPIALEKVVGLPHVERRRNVGLSSSLSHPQPTEHGTMQLSSARGPCAGRGSQAWGAFASSAASVPAGSRGAARAGHSLHAVTLCGQLGRRPCPVCVAEPWSGRCRTFCPILSSFLSFLPLPARSLLCHLLR